MTDVMLQLTQLTRFVIEKNLTSTGEITYHTRTRFNIQISYEEK